MGDAAATGSMGIIFANDIRKTIAKNDPYLETNDPTDGALKASERAVQNMVHQRLLEYFPKSGEVWRKTKEDNVMELYDKEFSPLLRYDPNKWDSYFEGEKGVSREVTNAYLQYLLLAWEQHRLANRKYKGLWLIFIRMPL